MEFLNIEIDKKMYIKLLIISIVLVIAYIACTMSSLLIIKQYKISSDTIITTENMNTHIDLLEIDGKKIEISGWVYKENEPIKTVNSSYVLKNHNTGKMYIMRTQMEKNNNIEDEELKVAGMHAQCLKLGLPKGRYDIYILYQNGEQKILVDTLIYRDI